jgi:hypothetical protein
MAIHPLLPGIEVAICVNQTPLREYDDDDSSPTTITSASGKSIKTMTKYIESTADQEFSIMCKFGRPHKLDSPTLNFRINIDSTQCRGMTLGATRFDKPNYKSGVHKQGQIEGQGYLLPFKFTKIETSMYRRRVTNMPS